MSKFFYFIFLFQGRVVEVLCFIAPLQHSFVCLQTGECF